MFVLVRATILRSYGCAEANLGRHAMDETTATSEMRVVTLNLWGRRGEWNERKRVLVEGFSELAPDLVAFQEAVVGDGYDQVADILGRGYHIVHQTDREADRGGDIEDGQGISIASRWPLREVWEPDLNVTPRTEDFACGTLIAEVFTPEPIGPLLFVNHLPNWQLTFEHERELQTVLAAAQGALHVLEGVSFQDGQGRGSCAVPVSGVEAPHRPRPRPRRLSHLPELFLFDLAGDGDVGPRVQAQDIRLADGTGGQVGEQPVPKRPHPQPVHSPRV